MRNANQAFERAMMLAALSGDFEPIRTEILNSMSGVCGAAWSRRLMASSMEMPWVTASRRAKASVS